MNTAYSIALSGLNANSTRVAVSANNVANALTPEYQPQEAVQSAQAEGGVEVSVEESGAGTFPAYQPDSANASAEGYVNLPNVDYAAEAVDQRMAVAGYKANAAVIRTLSAMDRDLLDIKV